MRIAIVTNHFPRFSETFIVDEFLGIAERNWDIHIVCNRSDSDQLGLFPQLQAFPELRERVHVTSQIDAELITLQPDLVHFQFGWTAHDFIHVKEIIGCRVVVSFRGSDLKTKELEDKDYYSQVWEQADGVHLCATHLVEHALQRGCPQGKPHTVIPSGIDTRFFHSLDRTYGQAGTTERPLRILSVGRLHWVKGYEYALKAVQLLAENEIAFEYRLIGDGDNRESLLFDAHDLNLKEMVRFFGVQPKSEVRNHLEWADVFLHPALSEGFCVATLEAQAMAVPVICTDAPGFNENVVDGETGFIVTRRNPQAIAEKLSQLALDPIMREQMGRAGSDWVATSFRLEDQIERLDALYRQVLGSRRPTEKTTTKGQHRALKSLADSYSQNRVRASALERKIKDLQQQISQLHEKLRKYAKDGSAKNERIKALKQSLEIRDKQISELQVQLKERSEGADG